MRVMHKGILFVLAGLALAAAGQESSFVPVNARMFRMRQPDGTVRMFVRDEEEPNLLYGEGGWTAELDGRQTLAMNDAEKPQDRRGFLFVNGYLRKQLVGERETSVRVPPPGDDPASLTGLWPDRDSRLVAEEAPDIWSGGTRLRLWFDNPNKAGLLFVELSLAALALVFLSPLGLRILGGILFLAAFTGLVLTSSRGALLSLLCGLAVVGLVRLRSLLTVRRMLLVLVAVGVVVGCLFAVGQGDRLIKNLFKEGQRETSRLLVWKEVPRMMADAPGGWGFGRSARAYIDWYQKKSDCLLKNLISGHLTLLVEAGWILRFVYLFGWAFLLVLSLVQSFKGRSPIPSAVLFAFVVAACFNPVLTTLELWLIPLGAVGCVLRRLCADRARFWRMCVACAAGMAGLVLVGTVVAAAFMQEGVRIRKSGDAVCLNGAHPDVWLVDDDYVLHGGYWWLFGRELRAYFSDNPSARAVGHVLSVDDLPHEMDTLVLVGEACRAYLDCAQRPKATHTIFLSPPFGWTEIPEDVLSASDVRLIAGTLATRLQILPEEHPEWVRLVPGAELYIPGWTSYLK